MTDPSTKLRTRTSVLDRARGGDAADLARIYRPLVWRMARRCGLHESDADDVAQQVLVALLTQMPTFRYDRRRGSFKGLLKKITRNRAADFLRRRRRESNGDKLPELLADDPFDKLFEDEWAKAVYEAALDAVRRSVKPTTFESFRLVVLERQPIEAVARALNLTPNQVSQNKRRVIGKLQEQVGELEQ